MKLRFMIKRFIGLVSLFLLQSLVVGCANLNDPYGYNQQPYNPPPPAPYYGGAPYYGNNPYYGGGYYGGTPYRGEQRELQRERERLEAERRRLEQERRNQQNVPPQYTRPSPPPPQADRCPSGFSPSERKCSPEERRRGCRDMRMPSGLGCVSR